tara:strand:- start:1096 stop:2148 length:1053 start_codon:yes stop_codon:yes gene_type:complete
MIQDLPKSLLEDSRKLLQQGADYEKFFKAALKKFGVSSPADFKSDEEKKKFFDYVDKNYKGEKSESVQEEVTDKDIKNIQKFEKQAGSQLSKMIKAYEKIVKSADKDTRSKMDGFTGNLYAAEDELRMIKNDLENAKVDQDTAKRKADPKNKANMARLGKKLGVNEEVSVKKYSRSYRLDEASLNYVYFDKPEATRFMSKIKSFVDSVEIEKVIAGHFNVIVKGDKKALKKATDVAIKMSESLEHASLNIQEGKKGKYKSKKMSKISQGIKKVISIEKKNGADVKDIQQLEKFIKSGLETEMYDDMEILTDRSLKQLDKLMSKLDTDPRDGVAQAIEKADPDLYDMMFGY